MLELIKLLKVTHKIFKIFFLKIFAYSVSYIFFTYLKHNRVAKFQILNELQPEIHEPAREIG